MVFCETVRFSVIEFLGCGKTFLITVWIQLAEILRVLFIFCFQTV